MKRILFLYIIALLSLPSLAQDFKKLDLDLLFSSDHDELLQIHKEKIRSSILDLQPGAIKEIYIEGHADSDASDQYNIELSERRAANAKQFLLSQGVKPHMIKMEYFGERAPRSDLKRENRRASIQFIYIDQEDLQFETTLPWISVITKDAKTGRVMPCQYVIEQKKNNIKGNTDRKGYAKFKAHITSSDNIVFFKSGYLSEKLDLPSPEHLIGKDSLFFEVILQPVRVVNRLRFNNIYFYTDTDSLKPQSTPELVRLQATLQNYPDLYIEIQGHMNFAVNRPCSPFQRIYNYNLSYKRAKAVYEYLVSHGIKRERLTYKGMSNTNMIYNIPASKAQEDMNKRVEVWTLKVL